MWERKVGTLQKMLVKKNGHFPLQASSENCFSFTLFNAHNLQYVTTLRLRQNRVEKCVSIVSQQCAVAMERGRVLS